MWAPRRTASAKTRSERLRQEEPGRLGVYPCTRQHVRDLDVLVRLVRDPLAARPVHHSRQPGIAAEDRAVRRSWDPTVRRWLTVHTLVCRDQCPKQPSCGGGNQIPSNETNREMMEFTVDSRNPGPRKARSERKYSIRLSREERAVPIPVLNSYFRSRQTRQADNSGT